MINLPGSAATQQPMSTSPMPMMVTPANKLGIQGGNGLGAALGGLNANGGIGLNDMVAALRKAKMSGLLQGKLPGVDPAALAASQGPPSSLANPALSLGGVPPQQ